MTKRLAIALFATCVWASSVDAADRPTDAGKAKSAMTEWGAQGLKPVTVQGLDLVYVKSDARLDGYRKVMLGSVDVAVDRNWKLGGFSAGSTTTGNLKPIIADTAAMVREELEKALEGTGFERVGEPAADAVRVDVEILDLYVMALESGRSRGREANAASLGRVALRASVVDSTSGELILRVFDREEGPEPRLAMSRAAEEAKAWLRSSIGAWAQSLRKGFEISNRALQTGQVT